MDQLAGLRTWLLNMQKQGKTKYFEVLADGIRVLHKTKDLTEFDNSSGWFTGITQTVRVQVYNTKNSHRARVFEVRTENYREGVSEKFYHTRKRSLSEEEIEERVQAIADAQSKETLRLKLNEENTVLKKRVTDAENYIDRLEREVFELRKAGKFDLEGVIKSLLPNKNATEQKEKQTTKNEPDKTGTKDTCPNQPAGQPQAPASPEIVLNEDETTLVIKTKGDLEPEHYQKLYEMAQFLAENQFAIDKAHEVIMEFKALLKAG